MSDLDDRIAARPAPKVTPDQVENVIVGTSYHRLTGTLTVCVLTLLNGFTVTGESACASAENYDQAIGEELAFKDANRKIWTLEGYALRDTLRAQAKAERMDHMLRYASTSQGPLERLLESRLLTYDDQALVPICAGTIRMALAAARGDLV